MKKLNSLLNKVALFEKLAVYGDRKSFLESLAQEAVDPTSVVNQTVNSVDMDLLDGLKDLSDATDVDSNTAELLKPLANMAYSPSTTPKSIESYLGSILSQIPKGATVYGQVVSLYNKARSYSKPVARNTSPVIPDNVYYNQLKGVNQQIRDIENRDPMSAMDPVQNKADKENLLALQKRRQALVAKVSEMFKRELNSIDTQLNDLNNRSPESVTEFQNATDKSKMLALQTRKKELQEKLYSGKGLI